MSEIYLNKYLNKTIIVAMLMESGALFQTVLNVIPFSSSAGRISTIYDVASRLEKLTENGN